MSSVDDLLQELFSLNQAVSAAVVIDMKGKVIGTMGGPWEVDASEVAKNLKEEKLPSLVIQGIKYSTFQKDEIKFIGTNMQGKGSVICANSGNKGWIVTYLTPEGDQKVGYRDVFSISQKMKAVI
ncbi:MAG: hypothetical protein ACW976_05830 [Candidatus Ranarchaeia archaeon]|jgi:hypothetical protein